MRIGLVGKPNVGKSTFFSAATLAQVDIANYPFCTIDPNVGVAFVEGACPVRAKTCETLEAEGRMEPHPTTTLGWAVCASLEQEVASGIGAPCPSLWLTLQGLFQEPAKAEAEGMPSSLIWPTATS